MNIISNFQIMFKTSVNYYQWYNFFESYKLNLFEKNKKAVRKNHRLKKDDESCKVLCKNFVYFIWIYASDF